MTTHPTLALAALLLAATATTPIVLAAPTKPNPASRTGHGWRALRLDLDVFLEPDAGTPEGGRVVLEGRMRLVLTRDVSPGPTLLLNASAANLEFQSLEVLVSPQPTTVSLAAPPAEVDPARHASIRAQEGAGFVAGDEIEVQILAASGGRSHQFAIAEAGALASWVEGWYPIPLPSPGAGLRETNAIPGETRFHMPSGWRAISNGRHLEHTDEGEVSMEAFAVEPAVARSFAAGPYRVARRSAGEREIGVALLPGSRADVDRQVETLRKVLVALEELWGPYPYPSYSIAEVPDALGGFYASSEQGFIMVKPAALGLPDGNIALFGHELAHGWFGNLLGTQGPGGVLCSEGLCQFSAYLAVEALEGDAAATDMLRFSRLGYVPSQCAQGYFTIAHGTARDTALSRLDSSQPSQALVNAKGHWVLAMLRRRVGNEAFFRTLRKLMEKHTPGGRLSVEGLREAFTSDHPGEGLETFFEQWLDRTGAPRLALEWRAGAPGHVRVVLTQRQPGRPYVLDVEVDVETALGRETHVVTLRGESVEVELGAEGQVIAVHLDPRHRILRWTPEYEN